MQIFKSIARIAGASLSVIALVALTGCAHPIQLTPSAGPAASGQARIPKSVAFYISAEDKAKEVIGPGGGGDKVSYFPYRDLEPSFYKALGEVFTDVTKLSDPKDSATLAARNVVLVITPTINTVSYSDGILTWPPTQFTVEFDCRVADAQGQAVAQIKASGQGAATFAEFTAARDFSLAARRASELAVNNLIKALASSEALRK